MTEEYSSEKKTGRDPSKDARRRRCPKKSSTVSLNIEVTRWIEMQTWTGRKVR